MRIGIYLNNDSIKDIDCTRLEDGNPGIGGTPYCILLLVDILRKYYPEYQSFMFTPYAVKSNYIDKNIIVLNEEDLINKCKLYKCDVLIIASLAFGKELSQEFVDKLDEHYIKTIVWAHNYYYEEFCNRIADSEMIKANVFVGKQQHDRYIDHRISAKSTYIYNMYPEVANVSRSKLDEKIVTYIGSLVPSKGFHILAKKWKTIIKEVPEAKLYIIGSGSLYNRNVKLGKYHIAEENYEKKFMQYLVNSHGELLESVRFFGILGEEKRDIILKTSVGIVNPSGRTETFGISALDFESCGIPVVTIAKGGFLDTVKNKHTGYLYRHVCQLPKLVVELLRDTKLNEEMGINGSEFSKNFRPELIISEWNDLILKVYNNKKLEYKQPNDFFCADFKWIRIFFRKVKRKLGINKGISVIGIESFFRKILR